MSVISDYRALHQIPELDKNLPKTREYIQNALKIPSFSPAEGSLCAFLDFEADSAIAFRADMDALPIREETGLPWASRHPGAMHACGHDGHMAMLLELARRLAAPPRPKSNILLLFQAAEETTGGAREICESGVLERYGVAAVFGLHIWPGLPAGKIYSKKGPMMARSCEIFGEFSAPAAHITAPGLGALDRAVAMYRRFSGEEADYLLKFGLLRSGTAPNVQPERALLRGTLRSLSDGLFEEKRRELEAAGFACSPGYPMVNNDPALFRRVRGLLPLEELERPSFLSEDFAWYQKYVPGLFFFLGAGEGPGLHRADFRFPEEILRQGAAFWHTLAVHF